MEDLGTVCPYVQILDLPVPQMVENVSDTLRFLNFPIAEQIIEVPKFSCSPCPSRSLVPEPQTAEQLVEVPTVLSPTRIALQIVEQIVDTPVPQGRGGKRRVQGFLPELGSTAASSSLERISERTVEQTVFPSREARIPEVATAFSGAGHVCGSPVPGERPDYGRLHGSVAGQSSTARHGAHLHELLPEDVVDEELQERLAAHVLWLERTRSVVLFSQRSQLYDEADGLGLCGALASPSSSGTALARCASSSRTCRRRTSCASARLSSSTPPHAGEFVGGPLSSLTTIPRLRTFWWCSRLRNLPCSSRMRSKQPRRHSLYDGIMRAAAVLIGEKRALVFRYGDLFAFGVQEYGFFWKTTSGMFPVFSSPWFDSGYMLGVSLRGLLASTLLRCRQAPDASHQGRYEPEGQ